MKMYNILGVMKGLNDNAKSEQLNESVKQPTVYENVEPKGSIMDAVKSLAGKFAKFNESAKPDYIDLDKDGDKKEPMKKAAKEKKAKPFSSDDYDEYGVRHSSSFNQPPKKAVKDKNNAKGAFKDMFGGDANDLTSKLKIKEGQGPYELYNPKHPKFKANYEKYKAKNPDCTLADFVDAMKKKEATMNEAAYDEPEAPNADAIAKRKRLQAIKDRQEDERAAGGKDGSNTPIRKVAGKAYGGAAQKDDVSDLDEVAPPGAKAERMVKHIKKGYAKDGKLSKKEKGIAYATAWKAHNKGQVEEGIAFGDTVKNSTPKLTNVTPMKLKESRMLQEGDYFYESIAKALCDKNPNLDTAGNEFVTAVRQEMVAQGITPNKARNILLMDEDFLSDVATSYGHYCKEVAEDINQSNIPSPTNANPVTSPVGQELDEIAKLAGLPTKQASCESCGMLESSCACQHEDALDESSINEAASRKDFRMVANLIKNIPDEAKRKELAQHHADIFKQQNPRFSHDKFYAAAGVVEGNAFTGKLADTPAGDTFKLGDKSYKDTSAIEEEEMEEGNEFSGALAAAKASGSKEFEVDGKKYTVKEDINVNITANGQEDALNLFRKLAGMDEVAPTVQAVELPQDAASAIAQGMVEPVELEVAEERDIEYTNTPNEKIGGLDTAIPSGTDMHRSKKSYSDKPYRGDNPMAVKEEALWKSYENLINSVKG